eukprot:2784435-Prymnesium_polylepis.1
METTGLHAINCSVASQLPSSSERIAMGRSETLERPWLDVGCWNTSTLAATNGGVGGDVTYFLVDHLLLQRGRM